MHGPRRRGFSLVEVLVVLVILVLLIAIALPLLARARHAQREVACLANLRQVAEAFHAYAAANDDTLPSDESELAWDEAIKPHLRGGFAVFVCPSDGDDAILSYGWRETFEVFDPAASLAGRELGTIRDPGVVLTFEDVPERHRDSHLNAASLDASTRTWEIADFEANLQKPVP